MSKYLGWARDLLQRQLPGHTHAQLSRPNPPSSTPGIKMKNLFTVVIAGTQYLLHPQKLGTIEETINPDALIPVTLLTTSEINSDLEGILDLFGTVDDVFQPDFGGILVEKPEKDHQQAIVVNRDLDTRGRSVLTLRSTGAEYEAQAAAFADLPSGPYFLHGPNLYQAWRLYDDVLDAFTFGVIPNSINGSDDGFEALSSLSDDGSHKSIAVPSRLYHPAPSIRKPLSGVRLAVTDAMSLKGVQTTMSSRAWTQLYGAEDLETAKLAQRLIDMGAIIVGKTKSSQLDSGREWVDVEAPWNPRGDGYQGSGGSAAGAGASVSGYAWMEHAVAADAFEGAREQGRLHGVYSIRASASAESQPGWTFDSKTFAAVGLMSRDLHELLRFAQVTINTSSVDVPFPKRIIYLVDYAPASEGDQSLEDSFVAVLEEYLGIKAERVRISETWNANPPDDTTQSLQEYMKEAPFSSFCYDFYHEFSEFRSQYKEKYGRQPYIEATPRFRWGIGESESAQDYGHHRRRTEAFRQWFNESIMPIEGDSETIVIVPFGPPTTVQYRDDLPPPPSAIEGLGPEALAPLLGLPHLVVPFAQTRYHSRVTDQNEDRPFSGSILGPRGSDLMLLQLVKAAFDRAGWRSSVDPGRLAFPQGYEPELTRA
ncbi:amidase signature enzyme [Trichoderma gracile]